MALIDESIFHQLLQWHHFFTLTRFSSVFF
nr:DUF2243 domain-containing protein [Salicibibacter halophilus]